MTGKSLMMTEAVMNPVINRSNMAKLLFEKFQVGRLQIGVQALMSLFAEAR
jgi:actin-related protein